jgi:hypothetical protein
LFKRDQQTPFNISATEHQHKHTKTSATIFNNQSRPLQSPFVVLHDRSGQMAPLYNEIPKNEAPLWFTMHLGAGLLLHNM